MISNVFLHEYGLFADDKLVKNLIIRPCRNDFLFVSRAYDIPLDRIYAKLTGCKLCLIDDLPF